MPTYKYTAKDQSGKTVNGSMDAADDHAAAAALRSVGLWPMRIEAAGKAAGPATAAPPAAPQPVGARPAGVAMPGPAGPPPAAGPMRAPAAMSGSPSVAPAAPYAVPRAVPAPAAIEGPRDRRVSVRDQAIFFRQLGATVHSGMPLVRCLETVGQESRGTLARICAEAAEAVGRGEMLSTVFARHPRVFTPLTLAMVRAGEKGGLLDECLSRVADLLERQFELQQRVKQQTFMPKLTVGAAVLIMVGVKIILSGLGASGRQIGAGMGSVVLPTAAGIVGLYIIATLVLRVAGNTRIMDGLKLSLPLAGAVARKLAVARFSRACASLYRAGVLLPEAVSAAADAAGNLIFAEQMRRTIPTLQAGGKLSSALSTANTLPHMAMSMLRTGEETGDIDGMLDKVADYCEMEAETSIKRMVATLQPVLTILLAIMVGAEVIRFYSGYLTGVMDSIDAGK